MSQININIEKLPTFQNLNTAQWSFDLQSQFSKAIEGVQSTEWFQNIEGTNLEKERLATAFAFAMFSHLRNRLNLAPDEELMLDNIGRKETINVQVND